MGVPPPRGLAVVKGTPTPQNIRHTLSPMDNTLILCSYQFLLSKRNQAAVLQRSNLNSHTEIGAMKVYTNTVISTHNIFYCTGLKNECPYLWKVCLSTLCANEISWPTYIHYITQAYSNTIPPVWLHKTLRTKFM